MGAVLVGAVVVLRRRTARRRGPARLRQPGAARRAGRDGRRDRLGRPRPAASSAPAGASCSGPPRRPRPRPPRRRARGRPDGASGSTGPTACWSTAATGRRAPRRPRVGGPAGLPGVPAMKEWLPFIVAGITNGSIYGLAAVGLVLTYKTSGIFNFAHGAQAALGRLPHVRVPGADGHAVAAGRHPGAAAGRRGGRAAPRAGRQRAGLVLRGRPGHRHGRAPGLHPGRAHRHLRRGLDPRAAVPAAEGVRPRRRQRPGRADDHRGHRLLRRGRPLPVLHPGEARSRRPGGRRRPGAARAGRDEPGGRPPLRLAGRLVLRRPVRHPARAVPGARRPAAHAAGLLRLRGGGRGGVLQPAAHLRRRARARSGCGAHDEDPR